MAWWLHGDHLSRGVSLRQVSPDLDFWFDASDVGWGAHLGDKVACGLWARSEALLPINGRELLAVRRGLLSGATVAVFCDNVTAVAYLRKEGRTRSPALNAIAQEILHWAESLRIRLAPQFIPGIRNVLADSLSRPHQLPGSEWSLNMDMFRSLSRQWPVMIELFATSANHRCSIYFSPFRDPLSAGTDALLQSWDGLLAYAFPPWSILRASSRCRWLLRWLFPPGQASSSHGLVDATRIFTGWPFMPGDYPAIHQSRWFLLGSSGAGFVGAPSILALQLSAQVVGLPVLVPVTRPLHLAPVPLQSGGFPLVAPLRTRS